MEKADKAITLSFDKTLQYAKNITNAVERSKSANVQKMEKLLKEEKQFMDLIDNLNVEYNSRKNAK
jgi:hypothetical protein